MLSCAICHAVPRCAMLCWTAAPCRVQAELEQSLMEEELARLLTEYVESRVREALASEHVQASLADRLKVRVWFGGVGSRGVQATCVGRLLRARCMRSLCVHAGVVGAYWGMCVCCDGAVAIAMHIQDGWPFG